MQQNLQQSAVQQAMQPVARYTKTGPEHFDICDTDDAIQQQADDNTTEIEDSQLRKTKEIMIFSMPSYMNYQTLLKHML